jgi:hypothetical protein
MLIAREGEEIVCPKGTVCGRLTRDAHDQIIDGDFTARESSYSHADQRYVCACCGRPSISAFLAIRRVGHKLLLIFGFGATIGEPLELITMATCEDTAKPARTSAQ